MKILKDLTRKISKPPARWLDIGCIIFMAALFLGIAFCGFRIALAADVF